MLPETAPPWRQNVAEPGARAPVWRSLWSSRELIGLLAGRDLRIRYKQTALGVIWVLLQPIASVAIFTLVFGRLAGISSQGVPYPLFALVGLVAWAYFSSSTVRASGVFISNPDLVTKVSFNRLAVPAAAVLPPLVDLAVCMGLVGVLMVYYGVVPTWRVVAVPVWVVLLVLTALGPALWLSALNVRYRDVQQALGPSMQIWLFASPVAYPSTLLSDQGQLLYSLNPMAGVLGLARWSLLGTPWPGWPLAVSLGMVAVVLAGGLVYFRRAERFFADVI